MPQSVFIHPLFGEIVFRTQTENRWVRGDKIFFISGFDEADIQPVTIPQLAHIKGAGGGVLRFHKDGHAQLKETFLQIEKAGLMNTIKTCAGSLNRRLRKPTDGSISKLPSNHAFGIAIDLNSDDGSLGASVAPVAPIFATRGFKWGKAFNDPMHFEVSHFIPSVAPTLAVATQPNSKYIACRQPVANRGRPPEDFLDELIAWGKTAADQIFAPNTKFDIYSSVVGQLGPWRDELHRRAAMLEVLRVLGGFESSWKWDAGRDTTNPTSNTPCTEEAGIFQCSGNSLGFSDTLADLLYRVAGDHTCPTFVTTTKTNHAFALEYGARLLRFTVKHHGPIKNGFIHPWLRRDAVDEFLLHL